MNDRTENETQLADTYAELRDVLSDDAALVRAVASGRQRNRDVRYRRVELRYVDLKVGRRLQLTAFDETQSHTRNVEAGEQRDAELADLLSAGYANWHVETTDETWQLRITKKGRPLLHRGPAGPGHVDRSHDRTKRRRLEESDPVFELLGISTADGKVKPSRMAKFRQVQDLLAALDPLVEDAIALGPGGALSTERPLRVVDLGCGNAYLTFAAFRYLTAAKELPVVAVGVDVKAQARAHNTDLAERLGVADRLTFVQSAIESVELGDPPDLVLALHACDTATDDALARAVRWKTPVIVAAPCCHHDIQRQLTAAKTPAPYDLVTRHGILRERLADVLTDSLRAAILRLAGYRVEVVEFVDSVHTPRNALIRAVRTESGRVESGRVEGTAGAYRQLVEQWKVEPALARLLHDEIPELESST